MPELGFNAEVYLEEQVKKIKSLIQKNQDKPYPVRKKPLTKSEVNNSVAVGGLKPPTSNTFLTGFT